ncbi:hypothetical protein ABVT39_026076 [Epinephelus coioides]
MIMNINDTFVHGNETARLAPSSNLGLAVGLTLFFLILAIVVGVIVYKYHSEMRNMLESLQTRSQKKEDYTETPQDDSHHYTSMMREQPAGQTPIYENLNRTGPNRPAANTSRFPSEPEEDVYLECDSPDDAIYSNDPACNLSILPDAQEEDVYIVPDTL